jgi:inositol phosphorylceramide mannosyltransferase catalytic subunit
MTSFLKSGITPDPIPSQPPFIPRILWQTSKDKTKIPSDLMACVDKLKAMNSTWEHRLFDDASQLEMLREVCSDRFLRAYARLQPRYGASRADLFRYVAIYLHGGAYLDLKSGTTRPLDAILRPEDHFIISQWDNGPDGMFPGIGIRNTLQVPGGEYEQWFVIAEPGHPFLAATIESALHKIENYNPFALGYGGKGVLTVTGPDAYTNAIRSLENEYSCRHICAWAEGLRYTLLADLESHRGLDKRHYGSVDLLPVTSEGLTGFALYRFKLLEALHWPIRAYRRKNNKRLANRRAKQAARQV